MKKILFILIAVSVLICLLVSSVSAATTSEFGEVERIEGMSDKSAFGTDGTSQSTSRVVLFDGEEYHTYPSYYICKNSTQTEPVFDELKEKSGKNYDIKSIIRIEFPQNITSLQSKFRYASNVEYIYLPPTVTRIGQDEFHNCSALKYINVPRDCTFIGNYAFAGCSNLEVLDMSEAKSLKSTGSNFGGNKITSLVFPEGFESFGGMSSASKLVEVKFPYTLKTMSGFQFAAFTEFVVPDNLTELKSKAFDYCSSLKKVTIPKSITQINSNAFYGPTASAIKEVVYTGSESDEIVATLKSLLPNATITYANHCDIYYGGEHKMSESTYVFSSFVEESYDEATCTACGKAIKTEVYGKIINTIGYSAKINGNKISITYAINKTSLSVYKTKTEKSFIIGATAAIVEDGTLKYNPVNDDLSAINDKTIVAPIDMEIYDSFDFIISGFGTEHYEKLLVMGAYVYDGSEIYYVDAGGCNTYATPFTFNSEAK